MSDKKKEKQKLSLKDYVAVIVAMLTTVLLPIFIITLFLIVFVVLVH